MSDLLTIPQIIELARQMFMNVAKNISLVENPPVDGHSDIDGNTNESITWDQCGMHKIS